MADTVAIRPSLIKWAIDRSRLRVADLEKTFPAVQDWLTGRRHPTLRQLERFAAKTYTPYGYFFLDSPPVESLPIPDYRTIADRGVSRPSPNLLDTLASMQIRQAWMRDYLIEQDHDPLEFVGSARGMKVEQFASLMRNHLQLDLTWAEQFADWEDAFRTLRDRAEQLGIMVASSSYVGLSTRRSLDPEEFRGFVLCDDYAPLVFINSADAQSAQMFTLAHELAHVWLGRDALVNLVSTLPNSDKNELLCNAVAAELLVPSSILRERWPAIKSTPAPFLKLARNFKVSPIVAARRLLDLGYISDDEFFRFYREEQDRWQFIKAQRKDADGGPSFYAVQNTRLGRRFAETVVRAVKAGRLLYREAYDLTDLKGETFDKYAKKLISR